MYLKQYDKCLLLGCIQAGKLQVPRCDDIRYDFINNSRVFYSLLHSSLALHIQELVAALGTLANAPAFWLGADVTAVASPGAASRNSLNLLSLTPWANPVLWRHIFGATHQWRIWLSCEFALSPAAVLAGWPCTLVYYWVFPAPPNVISPNRRPLSLGVLSYCRFASS